VGRKTAIGQVDVRFQGISGQKEGRRFTPARNGVSNSFNHSEREAYQNTSFCPADAC
jgi:hypothetical protein